MRESGKQIMSDGITLVEKVDRQMFEPSVPLILGRVREALAETPNGRVRLELEIDGTPTGGSAAADVTRAALEADLQAALERVRQANKALDLAWERRMDGQGKEAVDQALAELNDAAMAASILNQRLYMAEREK